MKKIGILVLFVVLQLFAYSQINNEYVVFLKDKEQNSYTISHPEAFLSAKAIERRTMYGIPYAENDLPVSPYYVNQIKATGVSVKFYIKWFNSVLIYNATTEQINQISVLSCVKDIKLLRQSASQSKTKDKNNITLNEAKVSQYKSDSKNVLWEYGDSYNQIHMLAGDELHNMGYRGKGILIAVLDAGFWSVDTLAPFDSLWANNRIKGTRDLVVPNGNVFAYNTSMHGMSVLSTMGGILPGFLIGTAPEADYFLVRTEDAAHETMAEEYYWAAGAELADSIGADIINSSLGYTTFDDTTQNHTYSELDGNTTPITIAADIAASKGMLVVNSAGNSGQDAWYYIGAPADADSILTVGAVNPDGTYATFSSKGPTADGRIKPEVVAQGNSCVVANYTGGVSSGGTGTSFSSPIIAGMSACLWQANRTFNNMQIRKAIIASASQYLSPDNFIGYGIPDFTNANATISVPENSPYNTLLVYPNPFTKEIIVGSEKMDFTSGSIFTFYDMMGRSVFMFRLKEKTSSVRIVLPDDLNSGIFLLKINADNTLISKILIKE